mmetsp:Transcript_9156/g.26400  ORF Transcript_9156/g.26400 Transcript_9156/m.26400 type:complete len:90 (-) Transcript_9156:1469-1738(-)
MRCWRLSVGMSTAHRKNSLDSDTYTGILTVVFAPPPGGALGGLDEGLSSADDDAGTHPMLRGGRRVSWGASRELLSRRADDGLKLQPSR